MLVTRQNVKEPKKIPPPRGGRVSAKRTGGGDYHRLVSFARDMRWNPTNAEEKLWRILRNEKTALGKFRRQHPFGGKYIADFISLENKLVIEIDGDGHDVKKNSDRDAYMSSEGYKVLRFTDVDILSRSPFVIEQIAAAMQTHPHPSASRTPSPLEGEGILFSERK